ncbi:AAA family ATPase [Lapidilactobacillus bayanensis]|uniref:AAA family ATPase n=1 Tax=Lapidilactobacillus bayanensis TaxID=2485998 RepID=UPI0013DDE975|nr:SMC family ATPase [Lapidilactobacillus bayanensis]
MRPLQLTLNYFGPYRHQQIDFKKFDQSSMFLISGPTGAGKSTIFDGLVFALYDKASGSQREPKEFRSDFATINDETSVELTFTHRGHYYQVIRKPRQMLAKKRGQGTTEQVPQIELTVYEDDTPTKEAKQFTKIDQANKYLADLLQLNAAQFRQIVLLPQGEFRQFLNGDSNEKEAVLRNLFQTQHYEQWVKQLQVQYKQLKDENGQRQQQMQTLLQQIDWEADLKPVEQTTVAKQQQLLQEQITQMKVAEKVQQQRVNKLKIIVEQQQVELTHRQHIKELFEQQAQGQQTLKMLQQQEPAIDQVREQLEKLQWAQNNQHYYQEFQQATTDFAKAKTQLTKSLAVAATIKKTQQELIAALTKLQTHENEQKVFQQQLIKYTPLIPKYQQITELEATKQQIIKDVEQRQQVQQQSETELRTAQQNSQTLKEAQQQLPDFYQIQRQLDQQQDWLLKSQELVQQAVEIKQQIQATIKQAATQQVTLQTAIAQQKIIQQRYQQMKSDYAAQQIAILQQDLLPGQHCPVCGSLDHSQMDLVTTKAVTVTEEMLDEVDQQRQNTEKQVNTISLSITTLQKQLLQLQQHQQEIRAQLSATTKQEEVEDDAKVSQWLRAQTQELTDAKKKLTQQQTDAKQQQQQLAQNEKLIQELMAKVQRGQLAINDCQRQLAVTVTQIQDIQQQLPSEFKNSQELATFLAGIEQQITTFKQQQQTLQQQQQQNQQQQTANKTDQQHYQQQVTDSQAQIAKLQVILAKIFEQKWPNLLFATQCQQFEQLLTQLNQQPQLTKQIDHYQQQVVSQQAILQQLRQQLKDYQEVPDSQSIQLKLAQLQQEQSDAQEQLGRVKSQINQQTKIAQEITRLTTDIIDITPLQELSELVRGNGSQKLGLERYVLQTYLTQVLLVANQRLAKLTKGRYRLALAQELGSARKNSGLELNVFDDYVGDYRSVRTLSGGESFIAALALALALGEVVQQQTGAIEINALFIDEGFGSLDEEALNTAIEALMSLESYQRMIGIISHVRELQTQIPAQLKVISHGNGESSIEYQLNDD